MKTQSASKNESSTDSMSKPSIPSLKWSVIAAFIVVGWALCRWLDTVKDRWYVFDPETLHQVAKSALASSNDTEGAIQHIVANLTETYPSSRIRLNRDVNEWMFNNAGGAMGAMYIIHASITEYLIIFGTPLGTEGHTGQHTADDYFYILEGDQWVFEPGQLEKSKYSPGEVNHMPRGVVRQYKMHEGCFALEYARGWIPPMLPFGFADTFASTLDFPTLYRTVRITGREMIRNLMIGKI
ncbi:hypothetical protein MD484_g5927, partial [Candolleomyces efflorescens]